MKSYLFDRRNSSGIKNVSERFETKSVGVVNQLEWKGVGESEGK